MSKCNNVNNFDDISVEKFESHFIEKFLYNQVYMIKFVSDARLYLPVKYDNCLSCYDNVKFTEHVIKKYIEAGVFCWVLIALLVSNLNMC